MLIQQRQHFSRVIRASLATLVLGTFNGSAFAADGSGGEGPEGGSSTALSPYGGIDPETGEPTAVFTGVAEPDCWKVISTKIGKWVTIDESQTVRVPIGPAVELKNQTSTPQVMTGSGSAIADTGSGASQTQGTGGSSGVTTSGSISLRPPSGSMGGTNSSGSSSSWSNQSTAANSVSTGASQSTLSESLTVPAGRRATAQWYATIIHTGGRNAQEIIVTSRNTCTGEIVESTTIVPSGDFYPVSSQLTHLSLVLQVDVAP